MDAAAAKAYGIVDDILTKQIVAKEDEEE